MDNKSIVKIVTEARKTMRRRSKKSWEKRVEKRKTITGNKLVCKGPNEEEMG